MNNSHNYTNSHPRTTSDNPFTKKYGCDPLNQNFRKFRSKTEWIGSVQLEKFPKKRSTFQGGPILSVGPVRLKWTVPFDHSDPFPIPVPCCSVSSCTKWRKILSTALLWIVNSRSNGVTCTSMYSYHRSVAASQAKCMFWPWTALKD